MESWMAGSSPAMVRETKTPPEPGGVFMFGDSSP